MRCLLASSIELAILIANRRRPRTQTITLVVGEVKERIVHHRTLHLWSLVSRSRNLSTTTIGTPQAGDSMLDITGIIFIRLEKNTGSGAMWFYVYTHKRQ